MKGEDEVRNEEPLLPAIQQSKLRRERRHEKEERPGQPLEEEGPGAFRRLDHRPQDALHEPTHQGWRVRGEVVEVVGGVLGEPDLHHRIGLLAGGVDDVLRRDGRQEEKHAEADEQVEPQRRHETRAPSAPVLQGQMAGPMQKHDERAPHARVERQEPVEHLARESADGRVQAAGALAARRAEALDAVRPAVRAGRELRRSPFQHGLDAANDDILTGCFHARFLPIRRVGRESHSPPITSPTP